MLYSQNLPKQKEKRKKQKTECHIGFSMVYDQFSDRLVANEYLLSNSYAKYLFIH